MFPSFSLPGAYLKLYVALTLAYLWYRFALLFLEEVRRPARRGKYSGELMSVLIPYYNEDASILRRTVSSCLRASGNKEVIVIDDGSPSSECAEMLERDFSGRITLVRYARNAGKRIAQARGFECASGNFVITVDSDTVVDRKAFVNLVKPFSDRSVGATTGNAFALNREENVLTRMIAARYWNAFNVERKSLSSLGIVTCCTGVLSAYRAELFSGLVPKYTSQRFLGSECTFGDDRHLTNLVLMNGYSVQFVQNATCRTQVPSSLKKFLIQQLRWKKSFVRESIISLRFAFRRSIVLSIEVVLNLLLPLLSIPVRLFIIASSIIHPPLILPYLGAIVTVAVIRNFFLVIKDARLAFYSILYAFVHEFIVFWLFIVAAFTLRSRSWGTR